MTTDSTVAQEIQPQNADAGQTTHDDQAPIYNKRQMSDVVARERDKAYERGRKDAESKFASPQIQQPMQAIAQQMSLPPQSLGGMAQMSPDEIRKMIYEETPKALTDQVNKFKTQQTVDSFVSKMKAAEAKYPGLENKLNELDYSSIAPIISKVNDMENAGDIMNELIENPMKMGNLTSLIYTQPKLAEKAIIELSNSIKKNDQAKQVHSDTAREPLHAINPSAQTGMDNGAMTVSDFRKIFRG